MTPLAARADLAAWCRHCVLAAHGLTTMSQRPKPMGSYGRKWKRNRRDREGREA
jgi:hypothetical protein